MSVIDTLSASEKKLFAKVFEEAADDVVEFGWLNGNSEETFDEDLRTAPRCIWIAVSESLDRQRVTGKYVLAMDLIKKHFNVDTITEVFDINDSHSDEEGQAWAYGELRMISDKLRGANALSEDKVTDTVVTEKTASGNTIGAVNLLKRFTNWCKGKVNRSE